MGKKKLFDKKTSIVFKLVPAIDKKNESRIMFQPVISKNCTLTNKEKQDIIKEFSNEHEFDVQNLEEHDDRFDGIPPQILQKIKGRTDLIINGKMGKGPQVVMEDEDFMVEEVSDEEMMMEQIEEDGEDMQQGDDEQQGSDWETDSKEEQYSETESMKEQEVKQTKPQLNNFQQDFPQLPTPGTSPAVYEEQVEKSKLTKKQIEILDGILPQNYDTLKISNVQMKMFDDNGNPVDGYDYSQHYSRVGGHVLAKFEVESITPAPPDIDIEGQHMPVEGKEIDDALDKADIYEQLEDDFFINLAKMDNVKIEQKKQPKQIVKAPVPKSEPIENKKQVKLAFKQPEFTEQQLFEAMNQMRGKAPLKNESNPDLEQQMGDDEDDYEDEQDDEDLEPQQKQQEEQDERQFHQLNKRERRIFMKNYVIPEVQDLQKQQLKIKLKTFKGVLPQQIHLKTIHAKIPFSQDIAMQETLNRGSDTSDIQTTSQVSSDDDDIVSYHTKHSTVSSSVNFIMGETKKKEKKPKQVIEPESELKKPVQPFIEKRNKQQTKQEKKLRKQALKDFKKQKRQSKKEFAEELKIQKKIVEGNTKGLLFGVSHVNIL